MNYIEALLTGKIEMKEFIAQLKSSEELQNEIRNLIPVEARGNPSHPLWERIDYESCKKSNFDHLEHIKKSCHFDGTCGDNLNIFDYIECIYSYTHPEIKCTDIYEENCGLYLDVIMDIYDGPEVRGYVETLFKEFFKIEGKTKRKTEARKKIREVFHVTDGKRPYWIQGGEWPMGVNTPMAFIERKKVKDGVKYIFCDVDTGEIREVKQYY